MVEIRIAKDTGHIPFFSKATYFLFGIAASSLIIKASINFLKVPGIYIGMLFCAILIFLGFTYTKKGSRIRLMTYGALATIIMLIVIYSIFMFTVSGISI